ncbi:hypothetical protein D3C86_1651860 [compost metagenome]
MQAVRNLEALHVKKLELRKQLKAMVRHLVATAKQVPVADPRYRAAFDNHHYSKVWAKVHKHVGIRSVDNFVTIGQLQKAIDFARSLQASLTPPTTTS